MLLTTAMSGRYFEELRGLVEERAVVFVAFDHEVAAFAQPIARPIVTQVSRDAADQDAGIHAAVHQQPAGERRRRGLAVGAGNHDRPRAPQKVIADRLRQRAIPPLLLEHRLQLRVAARNGVAHDHEIDVGRDVRSVVSGEGADLFRFQKRAHRRVDVFVRSLDVAARALQQCRQRRHRGAAHTDQMNLHATPASSITSRGAALATTRALTPNGSVSDGPAVWPEGKP